MERQNFQKLEIYNNIINNYAQFEITCVFMSYSYKSRGLIIVDLVI